MQKVTSINHVKFGIHALDNMEVTRIFVFNLHIQTILAKIMWGKLAECTASTIDQFFTWKQTFFGPNPTFPPPLSPPCNVVRKERLADESSNIASGGGGGGGRGGASEYCSNSGKRHLVPHILARIVEPTKGTNHSYLGQGTFGTCIKQDYRGITVAVKHYADKVSVSSVEKEAYFLANMDHPGNNISLISCFKIFLSSTTSINFNHHLKVIHVLSSLTGLPLLFGISTEAKIM